MLTISVDEEQIYGFHSVLTAVAFLRRNGLVTQSDNDRFTAPSGASARVTGRGAYAASRHITDGTEPAFSGNPVIADLQAGWDPEDPRGSIAGHLFPICEVLLAIGCDVPTEWEFEPGPMPAPTLAGIAAGGYPNQYLVEAVTEGTITAGHLLRAGEVLSRLYRGC